MKKLNILIVLSLMFLTSCSLLDFENKKNFALIMDSWKGEKIDNILSFTGYIPTRSGEFAYGKYYIFDTKQKINYTTPVEIHSTDSSSSSGSGLASIIGDTLYGSGSSSTHGNTHTTISGGQSGFFYKWCNFTLFTDPDGYIMRWTSKGNDCKALKPKESDWIEFNDSKAKYKDETVSKYKKVRLNHETIKRTIQ